MHCFCKVFARNRKDEKLNDLTFFSQVDTKKNFLIHNNNDDEFFTTNFIDINIKQRSKKLAVTKCNKIEISIKNSTKKNVEIYAFLDSEAEISLINNIFVKKFKLVSFDVSNCEIMIIEHNRIKFYDVYFVQIEISNANEINRFFNESFLEIDLNWSITLDLSWHQLSKIDVNWIDDKVRFWSLNVKFIFFITNRIEKIESKKLAIVIVNDKKKIFVMFVRAYIDEKTIMQKIHIERRAQIDSILMKIEKKSDITIIILECLKKFVEINNEKKIYELSNHEFDDHAINLKENKKSSYDLIYSLFENELTVLRVYFDKHLKNEFIKFSFFSIEVSILFVKKKNEILRLCVNYRDLNLLIIKNRYFLSLIDESLDRLSKVRIYTSLDMIATYNKPRIREENEWKTTFRTRYEHFEYTVLFFDFINALATFQSFVNKILTKRLDLCVIIYLNDIVIYFMNRKQHIENVKWMFQRLKKHKLFINNDKCKWFIESIEFLSFVISSKNVQMQQNKIDAIQKWSISKNVFEILSFLKLCNFYRRFIKSFNKLTLFLISMLKELADFHKKKIKRKRIINKSQNRNKQRMSNDFLILEIYEAFKLLRQIFMKIFIFQHFDSLKSIRVKIDVSNKIIEEILCQSNDENHWHFVIYFSRKMISIECNYEVHDKKFLIIIFVFKQWRHYLEKAREKVLVLTNHRNLNRFMTTTKLSSRQVRWASKLFRYDFVIDYRFDTKNFANDLSRKSNHMKIFEKKIENNRQILNQLRRFLKANSIEFRACIDAIQTTMQKSSQEQNSFSNAHQDAQDQISDVNIDEWKIIILSSASILRSIDEMIARKHIHEIETTYDEEIIEKIIELMRSLLDKDSCVVQVRKKLVTSDMYNEHWRDENEMLWHEKCLYLSSSLRENVIERNHDNFLIEHFDVKRILELIRKKYYWSNSERDEDIIEQNRNMRAQIEKYCEICVVCKRSKISRHKSYEKLSSFFISKFKWIDLTMNFVTKLFESKTWNEVVYDSILVVMNRLTKMIHYISVTKTMIAKNLAEILIREIIRLHDFSSSITINRSSIFIFKYHDSLCYALKIKLKLSTTYHSQIDDQTKRQNSIMKQYFRAFVNFEQNNWIELLFMTKFVYNNNKHVSTKISSFEIM